MIVLSNNRENLPTVNADDYGAFFRQEQIKFLGSSSWKKILDSFWREMRLNVSPNDVEELLRFLRNKRDSLLQAYRQKEFFVFWNRCFDSSSKQFNEDKFVKLLCIAYSNEIDRDELNAFFGWHSLTAYIDELIGKVLEQQKLHLGATINF